jgi:hypothetical protein
MAAPVALVVPVEMAVLALHLVELPLVLPVGAAGTVEQCYGPQPEL